MNGQRVTLGTALQKYGAAIAELGSSLGEGACQFDKALSEAANIFRNVFARPFQEIYSTFSTAPHQRSYQKPSSLPSSLKVALLKGHAQFLLSTYSPSQEDIMGYLPVLGTIGGIVRIVNAIFILGISLFLKLKNAWSGAPQMRSSLLRQDDNDGMLFLKNLIRGLFELIPVLGGGALFLYDHYRLRKIYEESLAKKARQLGIEDFR